ncbi:MAG TPA: bifunctional helix-turn-helix transcriptional regulator/GNAT family N-acetyltransferase [Burkholderiales bacterium]|nr:bifunctional helix-turn-helix transcriptional regulator/GNAT family N-acetyltransferase [Burkholderiales bacterium]
MVVASHALDRRVASVRRFNRLYTQRIGALDEGLLKSPFSLAEVRVLYEVAHRSGATAAELARDLALDPGYLSRILGRLARRGLVRRTRSDADARRTLLDLTDKGAKTLGPLEARSSEDIRGLLGTLSDAEQTRLVGAMATIEALFGARPAGGAPYVLRPHRPGDIGWIVHRHAALYAQEYGWDEAFEALVAEVGAKFIRGYDAKRERCWIAERDGEAVGSVILVRKSNGVAQLRLLLVEPGARGLGIGTHLVEECIRFARHAGYRKIMLWTNSILHAARRIYEAAGFRLVSEKPHRSFGKDLVGQTWELDL